MAKKTRILLIEDEEKIARFVELELLHEGYEVTKAMDGRSGLELAETGDFDLLLLDIMLPELNGIEVLRRLRKTSDVPVIMLTARDNVFDKVTGLDMGADDYVTKPFQIEELLARIRSNIRRQVSQEVNDLRVGPLKMDIARHQVSLQAFMENPGIVLSRETLLERVWGFDFVGETNVVDVYVRYLRQKIDDPYQVKLLHTVRGIGYCIRED